MATEMVEAIKARNGGYSLRIVYRVRGFDSPNPVLRQIQMDEALKFFQDKEPNESFKIRRMVDGFRIERFMKPEEVGL